MMILQKLSLRWQLSKYRWQLVGITPKLDILNAAPHEFINEIQNLIKIQRNTLVVSAAKCRTAVDIAQRDGGIEMANTWINALEKVKVKPYIDPKTGRRVEVAT